MNATENSPVCERKFAPLDFKHVTENGSFEGYASLFNKRDMGGDMVMPGAFAKCLKKRGVSSIRMLFQHDPNEPVGVWREIKEVKRGLFVQGQLLPEVARSREILSLMREGALDGLSIGFRTVKGRGDPTSGVRRLYEIDLWEISIVTFPMLPDARISKVKGSAFPTEREFERRLVRDAGFTRSTARAVICSGFKSLASKRDAAGEENQDLVRAIRQAARRIKR